MKITDFVSRRLIHSTSVLVFLLFFTSATYLIYELIHVGTLAKPSASNFSKFESYILIFLITLIVGLKIFIEKMKSKVPESSSGDVSPTKEINKPRIGAILFLLSLIALSLLTAD